MWGLADEAAESVCAAFSERLKALVAETAAILAPTGAARTAPPTTAATMSSTGPEASLQQMVLQELRPYLNRCCTDRFARMIEGIQAKLTSIQEQLLERVEIQASLPLVNQAALIGRICVRLLSAIQAPLCELLGATQPQGKPEIAATGHSATFSFIQRAFLSAGHMAYRVWTRFIAGVFADELRKEMTVWLKLWGSASASSSGQQPQVPALVGTPAGASVPIPLEPSQYIHRLLFAFQRELHRVEGYRLDKEVLERAISDLVAALLGVIEEALGVASAASSLSSPLSPPGLSSSPSSLSLGGKDVKTTLSLSQPASFQLLYDMQFLFAVLRLPPPQTGQSSLSSATSALSVATGKQQENWRARLVAILEAAEAGIDPIDLASSREAMQARLQLHLQRCAILYGPLIGQNPFPALSYSEGRPVQVTAPVSSTAKTEVKASPFAPKTAAAAASPPAGSVQGESPSLVLLAPLSGRIPSLPVTLYPIKAGVEPSPAPSPRAAATPGKAQSAAALAAAKPMPPLSSFVDQGTESNSTTSSSSSGASSAVNAVAAATATFQTRAASILRGFGL